MAVYRVLARFLPTRYATFFLRPRKYRIKTLELDDSLQNMLSIIISLIHDDLSTEVKGFDQNNNYIWHLFYHFSRFNFVP